VKPLVVGHWGTTPGQNFIYVHLNRVIKEFDLDMDWTWGGSPGGVPRAGHCGVPAVLAYVIPRRPGPAAAVGAWVAGSPGAVRSAVGGTPAL